MSKLPKEAEMALKESRRITLFGDLDGMTVAEIRNLLDEYPDDARVDAQSELAQYFGGHSTKEEEFFVFVWME
jgi:hypothetical protein